jgi:hypothetical protein
MSGPVGTSDGGREFLRAPEPFQGVNSRFLQTRSTHRLGEIARGEISRLAEIFREDYEIHMTFHRFEQNLISSDTCTYIQLK